MAQATWEKQEILEKASKSTRRSGRWKFLVGGLLILASVGYLIVSGTVNSASYFITVDELLSNPEYVGQTVRVSGAVPGGTISYDSENLVIEFEISHIPTEFDNLAEALHVSVSNPDAARMRVIVTGEPKPDLLQHEAQAILTGQLQPDGTFVANELLLKCPSRFEEAGPDQSIGQPVDASEEYREAYSNAG